jgi:hypothetical protein
VRPDDAAEFVETANAVGIDARSPGGRWRHFVKPIRRVVHRPGSGTRTPGLPRESGLGGSSPLDSKSYAIPDTGGYRIPAVT